MMGNRYCREGRDLKRKWLITRSITICEKLRCLNQRRIYGNSLTLCLMLWSLSIRNLKSLQVMKDRKEVKYPMYCHNPLGCIQLLISLISFKSDYVFALIRWFLDTSYSEHINLDLWIAPGQVRSGFTEP